MVSRPKRFSPYHAIRLLSYACACGWRGGKEWMGEKKRIGNKREKVENEVG